MLVVILALASPAAADLPAEADLRPIFAAHGLEAKSQAPRGCCSLFALCGVLEFELAQSGARTAPLSEEFLNWASHQSNGRRTDGSFFSDALRGLWLYGVCREDLWPYAPSFDPDATPSPEALADAATRRNVSARWIKRWDVNTGMTGQMLAQMRQELYDGHPVALGMRWPKREQFLEGDVLAVPEPQDVFDGHSVLLVGYRDDPAQPGGGLFVFRNHAGPQWRQNGYASLPYDYVARYGNDALTLRVGGADPLPCNADATEPLEAETLAVVEASGCEPGPQDMTPFCAALWSGGEQLFCAGSPEARLTLQVPVAHTGHYDLNLYATRAPDFATLQVMLDSQVLPQELDLYAPEVLATGRITLGTFPLTAGAHAITFQITGKNPDSVGYHFGLDCLELRPATSALSAPVGSIAAPKGQLPLQ